MDEFAVERPLSEQRRDYGAAPEDDGWWFRRARYTLDAEAADVRFAAMAELEAELERFAPPGDVLELAAGTGNWQLVDRALKPAAHGSSGAFDLCSRSMTRWTMASPSRS